MDGEKMRCEEYSGEALEQVDYKTICASTAYSSGLLVFCGLELLLLVAVVVKLTCDCVEYKRTGNLPWCARWVLGRFKLLQLPQEALLERARYTPAPLEQSSASIHLLQRHSHQRITRVGWTRKLRLPHLEVCAMCIGLELLSLPCSSGGSQGGRPGGRETAVVRFLPQQQ